jgi:hypothetical protein
MAELVTIILLAALAAFVIWDSSRTRRVSREEIEKGFRPGWKAAQVGLLAFAGVLVWFGADQWIQPSHPPFEGRGAFFFSAIYALLGQRGAPLISWMLAAILTFGVIAQWRKKP